LRLFACACCRHVWQLIPDVEFRDLIENAEQLGDGLVSWSDVDSRYSALVRQGCPFDEAVAPDFVRATIKSTEPGSYAMQAVLLAVNGHAEHAAEQTVMAVAVSHRSISSRFSVQTGGFDGYFNRIRTIREAEKVVQATFCRDIFQPFRDSTIDGACRAWHSGAMAKLAESIHAARAFDRLPVLADALEEAGCTDAEILGHCRGPGPHVRGCWVVDLILGKE
jgi:hypothetical protein